MSEAGLEVERERPHERRGDLLGAPEAQSPGYRRLIERVPRVWIVAGAGWAARLIQVAAQLVVIRILTDRIGTANYSAFAVLASLTTWLALADLSLGFSLQNHMSERRAAGRGTSDIELTAVVLSIGCAAIAVAVVFAAAPLLSRLLLGEFTFLSPDQRLLAFSAMVYPAIGTALGGIVYRIWFADHRGYLSNIVPALGTLIGLVAVWNAAQADKERSLALVTVAYYAPLAILPLAALAFRASRASRTARFRSDLVRPLLRRAFQFWGIGVAAALVLQVDYIILARTLGAAEILVYNVASKVFALFLFVYTALLMAVWPVCAEAMASGEVAQVRAMLGRYVAIGIAFTIACGAAFLVAKHQVMALLAPASALVVPNVVILLLTVYGIVRVWTDTFSMALQSMNDLRVFWIAVPLQAVLGIAFQVAGAALFGLPGLVGGLTLCFVVTVSWILPYRVSQRLRPATLQR